MRAPKVGLLTFSDGRRHVHNELLPMTREFQARLSRRLEEVGWEVVTGREIIWTPELARSEGRFLAAADVEATIFNFAIWSFPHLPAIASQFAPGPFLLFSNVNPRYPGLVGMLASAGALDQIGAFCARVSGDIGDDRIFERALQFLRASTAVNRLRGETYGLIGGRSMGMYTAQSPLDQWQRQFGIDVEHLDQFEIVRRAAEVSEDRVEHGFRWLEQHVGEIRYDGKKLTPELLKRQIRSYHAVRDLVDEWDLDFCGIKGQPELTNHFCTMDIAEAFCNDPYDWEGPHDPIVCATEADMDGALTMELFKHLAGTPVLFADVRHYDADDDVWDLCNSGQHATYFAGRSLDPAVNLPKVRFYPEIIYFPAGGASVAHIAAPGAVTLARLARRQGRYWMAIVPAEFVAFPEAVAWKKAEATTVEWPHAFARFRVSPDVFLSSYDSNHIHGVYGDYVQELTWLTRILGIDLQVFA